MRKAWPEGTTLAEALANERTQRGEPTLQAMADGMGTNTTTVSRWLADGVPSGPHVDAVAGWLGTDKRGLGELIAETLSRRRPRNGSRR